MSGCPNGLQFPLHNMALWGLGLPLFVAALAGAAMAGARLWRQPRSGPALLLLALLVQFAVVGLGAHPTLRYFLPAYPLLVVFAAHYLLALKNTGVWRYGPILLVLIATLVWALAFSARPLPASTPHNGYRHTLRPQQYWVWSTGTMPCRSRFRCPPPLITNR